MSVHSPWKRWIPWILLIKLSVLGLLLYETRKGHLDGEVEAIAGEAEAKATDSDTAENTQTDTATTTAGKEGEADKKSENYGYLEDLIHLPKLEPEKMQKEELAKYLEIADQAYQKIHLRLEEVKRKAIQLEKVEKTIDEKLKKMEEERAFLAQTLQKEKDLQKDRTAELLTFYEKMEPKKAAVLIEKLDKDLVVALFQKLKKKQVTAILENMNPQKSAELTEYFGRVGSAREYELLKEMNVSLREAFHACRGLPLDSAPENGSIPKTTSAVPASVGN
jgi:flagellar motility protein MotE (MotC chaperone)